MTTNRPTQVDAALLAARIAYQRRQASAAAYTAALAQAHKAGCTHTEIASTLGITRQAVRQYLLTN